MKKNKKQQVTAYKDLKEKVAIIWTRVSSYQQEKENCSLDTQKVDCEQYALENNIRVKYYRGGHYESAKTEGKGLQDMIRLARQDKEVNVILVRTSSRFGRAGVETSATKSKLKKDGIFVIPAKEYYDPDDKGSVIMDGIRDIFNNYDNEVRREATYSGTIAALNRGEWCLHAPLGYKRIGKTGTHHTFEITPMGEILRNAWLWRAKGMRETEIVCKLNSMGLRVGQKFDDRGNLTNEGRPITIKYLCKILKNRFYTGWIEHPLVNTPNHRIKGNHPALIDETTFNLANGFSNAGYEKVIENKEYPLNSFIRCYKCGHVLSGYTAKRKNKKNKKLRVYRYYKCSTHECKQNFVADVLHEQFVELLKQFHIKEELIPLFRQIAQDLLADSIKDTREELKLLKSQKTQLENKKEEVTYRFATGEIDKSVYEMAIQRIQKELDTINIGISQAEAIFSNTSGAVQKMIVTSCKLGDLWKYGEFKTKQKLQNLVFPDGIEYSTDFGYSRTSRVNEVFEIILFIISQLEGLNKTKGELDLFQFSSWSRRGDSNARPLRPERSALLLDTNER